MPLAMAHTRKSSQTTPTSSISSESLRHSNVAAIAGGITGGICLLFIFGLPPSPTAPNEGCQIHGSQVDSTAASASTTRSTNTSIRKPPMRMQNSSALAESLHSGREGSEREEISQLRSNLESLQHEI
ncbi:hypothetical protein BDP27DRAFT_1369108 [Rhodocollybia butyracea]|uniref:Uncharacterized protein n=1 Tax=Rhodocollybia butyracea TaxID=206335 RepID=A0A9P5PBN1_9AGAR|nr:hypothetical protein BDP27DRAFT_1369108 [Rhodocollybia butyracea]